jgi:hypothetical protein
MVEQPSLPNSGLLLMGDSESIAATTPHHRRSRRLMAASLSAAAAAPVDEVQRSQKTAATSTSFLERKRSTHSEVAVPGVVDEEQAELDVEQRENEPQKRRRSQRNTQVNPKRSLLLRKFAGKISFFTDIYSFE